MTGDGNHTFLIVYGQHATLIDAGVGEPRHLAAEDAVLDVLQPDVARSGGVSETKKIVDLASAHHVAYAPHVGFSGAVCVAATLHLAATATNFLTYECIHTVNPLRERLAVQPLGGPEHLVDGQIPIPDGPGLGIDLDPDALRLYRQR